MAVDINKVDKDGFRVYDDKGNYIPKGKRIFRRFYHVTSKENVSKIMKEGLVPRITEVQREEAELVGFKPYPHINLWGTLENARLFIESHWGDVVFEVNLPSDFAVIISKEPIPEEITEVMGFKGFVYRVTKTIPPKYLKIIAV